MYTFHNGNKLSNYNLRNPFKKSKHMPVPMVTKYALIFTKVAQDMTILPEKQFYTKKELVSQALGHLNEKYKKWLFNTPASFCNTFASFNYNRLILFNKSVRKWEGTNDLIKYIKYHFGPYTDLHLPLITAYNDAVKHNTNAQKQWDNKKNEYRKMKIIGQEYFFQ